jgi:FkbM family methyltransferase
VIERVIDINTGIWRHVSQSKSSPLNSTIQRNCFVILMFIHRIILFVELRLTKLKRRNYRLKLRFDPQYKVRVGDLTFFWSSLLKENANILEVGAFDGRDTVIFANQFPRGQVLAFEPDTELFVDSTNNTRMFSNVTVFPYAVSDKTELKYFYRSHGASRASGSLREPTEHIRIHPRVTFDTSEQIPVIAIDLNSFFRDKYLEIDLLWIDAQGHELSVLQGASDLLKNTRFIFCEVSNTRLYKNAALFAEIADFLKDFNFELVASDISMELNDQSGNALFRNVSILER